MIEAPHYSAAGAKKKAVTLPEALFDGTVRVADVMTFVRVYARILDSKCKALRTKAAIEKSNAVPVARVDRIIRGLVRLLVRYVPRGLQPEVERALRLLEVSDDADVREPTCAKK